MELVRKQAELLVSVEQELKEKRKHPAGKQGMDAGGMKAEMKKLEDGKVSDYESYKAGKISREMFMERKKASDIRRQELAAALAEYDKSIMASLIAGAKVMGEDCMEVTWKYQDVYEKILGEMQR